MTTPINSESDINNFSDLSQIEGLDRKEKACLTGSPSSSEPFNQSIESVSALYLKIKSQGPDGGHSMKENDDLQIVFPDKEHSGFSALIRIQAIPNQEQGIQSESNDQTLIKLESFSLIFFLGNHQLSKEDILISNDNTNPTVSSSSHSSFFQEVESEPGAYFEDEKCVEHDSIPYVEFLGDDEEALLLDDPKT